MKTPNYPGMAMARAEIDDQLNKVCTLIAQPPDGQSMHVTVALDIYIDARINKAREALHLFESAAKGGAA